MVIPYTLSNEIKWVHPNLSVSGSQSVVTGDQWYPIIRRQLSFRSFKDRSPDFMTNFFWLCGKSNGDSIRICRLSSYLFTFGLFCGGLISLLNVLFFTPSVYVIDFFITNNSIRLGWPPLELLVILSPFSIGRYILVIQQKQLTRYITGLKMFSRLKSMKNKKK